MKLTILGAAALSTATASASTIVVSLGSCASTSASQQTPFEVSTGITTPLPSNDGPFCSVQISKVSSDLIHSTAQCSLFAAAAQTPFAIASILGGPYTASTPITSILCTAVEPPSRMRLAARQENEPTSSSGDQITKRKDTDPTSTSKPADQTSEPNNQITKREDTTKEKPTTTSEPGDHTSKMRNRRVVAEATAGL